MLSQKEYLDRKPIENKGSGRLKTSGNTERAEAAILSQVGGCPRNRGDSRCQRPRIPRTAPINLTDFAVPVKADRVKMVFLIQS